MPGDPVMLGRIASCDFRARNRSAMPAWCRSSSVEAHAAISAPEPIGSAGLVPVILGRSACCDLRAPEPIGYAGLVPVILGRREAAISAPGADRLYRLGAGHPRSKRVLRSPRPEPIGCAGWCRRPPLGPSASRTERACGPTPGFVPGRAAAEGMRFHRSAASLPQRPAPRRPAARNGAPMSTGPLARFKVIDLTRVRAGPTAVRQLADWGADVMKIEAPEGDAGTRRRAPRAGLPEPSPQQAQPHPQPEGARRPRHSASGWSHRPTWWSRTTART